MRSTRFRHELVDAIPERLQRGILYVAKDGDVAGHLCACGCGREVITPLSSTDWSLTVGRRGATLDPSIGNWAFPCRSHYLIWDGGVVWASDMSTRAIALGRQRDKARKRLLYEALKEPTQAPQDRTCASNAGALQTHGQRLMKWWKSMFDKFVR
jgi:hypothetical protein